MGPTLDAIVTALDAHKVGSEWKALCPCHDDHNPSLSITEKNGKPVVICRAGCEQSQVWSAVCEAVSGGTTNGKVATPTIPVRRVSAQAKASQAGALAWFARHTGLDLEFLNSLDLYEDGDSVVFTFTGLRAEKLRSAERKGEWRHHEIVPPLWPRPSATMPERLHIAEGESDACTLLCAGYSASGITLGASSKLAQRDLQALRDAGVCEVVFVGDADGPGHEWAETHVRAAQLAGLKVFRVDLDALVSPFGSDVKDANGVFQTCASIDEFRTLIDEHTTEVEAPPFAVSLDDVLTWADEEVEWIIPDQLARGDKAILAAPQKSLKTYLALELTAACATRTSFLGVAEWTPSVPLRVLFVEEEGSRPMFGRRFRRVLKGRGAEVRTPPLIKFRDGFSLMDSGEVDALIAFVLEREIDLVILDPLQRLIPGVDENDNSKMKYPGTRFTGSPQSALVAQC